MSIVPNKQSGEDIESAEFAEGQIVICILNNRGSLTIGKQYKILSNYANEIVVENDDGERIMYTKRRFMSLNRFRDIKIKQINTDEK